MQHSPDTVRAALLLTNRLVSLDARRSLHGSSGTRRSDRSGRPPHRDAGEVAEMTGSPSDEATRLVTLLGRVHGSRIRAGPPGGSRHRTPLGSRRSLSGVVQRLGRRARRSYSSLVSSTGCRDRAWGRIVGSRDASDEALPVARKSAEHAVAEGWPVVSGLARGVDQVALSGALEAGGVVVVLLPRAF